MMCSFVRILGRRCFERLRQTEEVHHHHRGVGFFGVLNSTDGGVFQRREIGTTLVFRFPRRAQRSPVSIGGVRRGYLPHRALRPRTHPRSSRLFRNNNALRFDDDDDDARRRRRNARAFLSPEGSARAGGAARPVEDPIVTRRARPEEDRRFDSVRSARCRRRRLSSVACPEDDRFSFSLSSSSPPRRKKEGGSTFVRSSVRSSVRRRRRGAPSPRWW